MQFDLSNLDKLDRPALLRLAQYAKEYGHRTRKDTYEGSLTEFIRAGWRYIDPSPFVTGWHLDAIADHLQAVTHGQIRRLLINVPPRTSKSSLVSVAWPAWTWAQGDIGPLSGPQTQFLFASYSQSLSLRDSVKTRRLIESPWYQSYWGGHYKITSDQNTKVRFETDTGGYRLATSVGGALMGEGAAIIVVDDAHNATEVESETVRTSTLLWWDEALSTRLNDLKTGAYVIIMQRLHEQDLTGHILEHAADGEWCHLMLPMRLDEGRRCYTSIGFSDPRQNDGDLLCPDRFGEPEVQDLERRLGPWASAGQLQQSPAPRGGGIFKREWWQLYEPEPNEKPFADLNFDIILAAVDGAFTEKEENDPSAMSVWGVYRHRDDPEHAKPRLVLIDAWRKHLQMHGPRIDMEPGETKASYDRRTRGQWGLVEWIADTCKRCLVDRLLIEAKASGITAAQEMQRLYGDERWSVELVTPVGDKVSRAHAVVPTFSQGLVYAPDNDRAEMIISEMETFPKGRYDDLTDTATMVVGFIRQHGMLQHPNEVAAEEERLSTYRPRITMAPLYPV